MVQATGGGGHPSADPGGGVQRCALPGRSHRGRENCQAGPRILSLKGVSREISDFRFSHESVSP